MSNLVRKAQLVEVNGQDMTTDGRFHPNLLADYVVKQHLDRKRRQKWVTLREAAVAMFHSGVLLNQEKIRKGLNKLAVELKAREFCLVVEPINKSFKIYEGNELEKHYVLSKQGYWEARARRAGEWSNYLTESVSTESEHETPVQAD